MKNDVEVVIIEVVPKMFDIVNTPEKFSHRVSYIKEVYEVNQPITLRPEYLAVREPGDSRIELLFKIDQLKSNFEKGQLVPDERPIFVHIHLRMKERSTTHIVYSAEGVKEEGFFERKIWYTSFKTLLTHHSTDEFMEEKSKLFTRVKLQKEFCAMDFTAITSVTASFSITRKAQL
ncbi:MAG: hypothetical protein ABSF65_07865 [Candidatus Bathyarchaeia archaeon]|jgi:hypothetical protein